MIIAKEALEIAKLNTTEDVSEHIAYIEKLIKKAIEKGDTKITIQKIPYARLFHEDRSSTTQEIINVLKIMVIRLKNIIIKMIVTLG